MLALKLDVTDRAAYARAADAAEARFSKIHILCNNAGVAVVGPTELATFADWDWVMGVNLGGTINGIVTILPRIKRHGEGGHIVNTASMSGLVPHPGATLYGTSKGAAVHMMECMRAELEPQGIICSAFCPGAVQSNIAEAGQDAARPHSPKPAMPRRTSAASRAATSSTCTGPRKQIGQRVLQGILNDELYIMTHSEFRQGVEERAQAMCAAVPDLPENEEYKNTFSVLFRNPIHAAETARQKRIEAMKDFAGRTAFVTGGANGIGIGLVRALLAQGCNVAIADIRQAIHRCGPEVAAGQPECHGRAGRRVLARRNGAGRGCRSRPSSGP